MDHFVLNPKILEDFNSTIEGYDDFLINRYGDLDGKNKWNVICSCKEWLHTAIYGIPYINLKPQNQELKSLNVLQLMFTLDLVVQAIQQLYRIFTESDYPLKKDRSIFKESNRSDDEFFHHVRAAFGAHPVNLKEETKSSKKIKRYYASWSDDIGTKDFGVYIYSLTPNEEVRRFEINYVDLYAYVQRRFELLYDLQKIIEKQNKENDERFRNCKIQAVENPLEQLKILKNEHLNRKGSYGYLYDIKKMINLYSAPGDLPEHHTLYAKYLNSLKSVIVEIQTNMQQMNFKEIKSKPKIKIPREYHYDIEKIYEFLNNPNDRNYQRAIYHVQKLVGMEILPSYTSVEMNINDLLLVVETWIQYHFAK